MKVALLLIGTMCLLTGTLEGFTKPPRPDGKPPRTSDGKPTRPSDGKPTRPSDGKPTRPSDDTQPRPSDDTHPRPSDDTHPRPSDGNPPRPSDGNPPKPSDGKPTRPSVGKPPRPVSECAPSPEMKTVVKLLEQLLDKVQELEGKLDVLLPSDTSLRLEHTWQILTTGTYAFLGEPCTWYEARDKCKAIGGYLVEINSQAEMDLIVKTSHAIGWKELKLAFWLGLNDIQKEGAWVWEHSQRRLYSQRRKNDEFRYWKPRRDNDKTRPDKNNEDCALAKGNTYGWHKSPCDTKKKLGSDWTPATICKRDG